MSYVIILQGAMLCWRSSYLKHISNNTYFGQRSWPEVATSEEDEFLGNRGSLTKEDKKGNKEVLTQELSDHRIKFQLQSLIPIPQALYLEAWPAGNGV